MTDPALPAASARYAGLNHVDTLTKAQPNAIPAHVCEPYQAPWAATIDPRGERELDQLDGAPALTAEQITKLRALLPPAPAPGRPEAKPEQRRPGPGVAANPTQPALAHPTDPARSARRWSHDEHRLIEAELMQSYHDGYAAALREVAAATVELSDAWRVVGRNTYEQQVAQRLALFERLSVEGHAKRGTKPFEGRGVS